MRNTLILLTAVVAFSSQVHAAPVIISDFGTSDSISTANFNDTWVGSLTESSTSSTIGTPATDFGNFIMVESFDLTSNTQFSISARLESGNTATGFIVTAYTTLTDFASATFESTSFNPSAFSTSTVSWTTSGSFDPANVIGWGISGGAPASTTVFRVSFDNLTAVPEPTTWALLAGSLTITTLLRRRRRV